MSDYTPTSAAVVLSVLAVLLTSVLAGFGLTRLSAGWCRGAAWLLPVGGFVLVERLTAGEPAGVRMIAICLALLYGMKGVVGVESRLSGERPLGPVAWFVFCLGWFGMRPRVFATFPGPRREGVRDLVVTAGRAAVMGAICIGGAFLAAGDITAATPDGRRLVRELASVVPLMIGLSLLVHFALFDVLTAVWRAWGANTRKLFRRPIVSRRLTEFWGRRWNLAFSEMAAIAVFRPLKDRVGTGPASTAAFLFSGLLHELAISVPVRAGYGLPFAYFVLHAIAMRYEAGPLGRALDARPWLGRAWTFAWLLVPLPLLFHPAFVRGVLLPIVGLTP